MSRYFEDTEDYLAGVIETLLETGTDDTNLSFEDSSEFQVYLEEKGVPGDETEELTYPPENNDDLGLILETLQKYEVLSWE